MKDRSWRGILHANFLSSSLRDIGTSLLDIIAPARCLSCLEEGCWLCRSCSISIAAYPFAQVCIGCQEKSPTGRLCRDCQETSPLSGVLSAGLYQSPSLRRGIHWLKFKGIRGVAPSLSMLLLPHLLHIAPISVLQQLGCFVPIPLHYRRQQQRGFNQSQDIAEALSHMTHIPTYPVLSRTKATWSQAHLPRDLRPNNTAQAFLQSDSLPSHIKYVMLVDDVTTSGSTLAAAADSLAESDSHEVWGLTIARG